MAVINKQIPEKFLNILLDWDYEEYLMLGGYGSGKSYTAAYKIVLKLLQEKRTCLVVREVFGTLYDSCFSLFYSILDEMNLVADTENRKEYKYKAVARKVPLEITFPNGSRIVFKGMDKPDKVKSIHGVSIVWMEECSELKYDAYKELQGRIRVPDMSLHFILTCNPVSMDNWVYRHFFKKLDEKGEEVVILNDERLYAKGEIIHKGTYYHHSLPDDNPFLPKSYIRRLDDIQTYDQTLYRVARWGRFGVTGNRVLPQFVVASSPKTFKARIKELPLQNHYFGVDFGFEESYNAVISCAVDHKHGILYIYDEIYRNGITDDKFAQLPEMVKLRNKLNEWYGLGINKLLVADDGDPKAISYYRTQGFRIRPCRSKFKQSRLSNTRKIKRFKMIVCSPKCKNTIRELSNLTYARDRNGNTLQDEFTIDPHTLSAIWYALDTVDVADPKSREFYSRDGDGLRIGPKPRRYTNPNDRKKITEREL